MHSLINEYRVSKKILLSMEAREMQKITQDYEQLPLMGKVEVFTEALRKTTGNGSDLYEIVSARVDRSHCHLTLQFRNYQMWMKSINSEEWLERRTRFTRSLAVMSMVGYILGLGDRHPSNLMLDKQTGRVLHIDFGDCFEVAQNREKVSEKLSQLLSLACH
jgi:serine/threonine-protein kinase mTOR